MEKTTPFQHPSIIEEEACQWIVKIEGDSPPKQEDIRELHLWMARSPKHKEVLLLLAKNWNEMDALSYLMIPLEPTVISKHRKLKVLVFAPLLMLVSLLRAAGQSTLLKSRTFALTSLVAVLFTVGVAMLLVENSTTRSNNIFVTNLGKQSTYTLEDGSTLWLNSNSEVEVNYTSNKRLIHLIKGEAHFKVKPDAHRPFEVYAGERMIKAVGTAFSVYRLQHKIEVMVTEGIVDLTVIDTGLFNTQEPASKVKARGPRITQNESPRVVKVIASITAGQSAAIPLLSGELETHIVEHEPGELARQLSWLEGRLVFAGESLEEVVTEVSRHTPIIIEVNDPQLKKLRIGGQFQAGETDALFDVLETGFGIKITHLNKGHVQLNAK